MFLPLFLSLLHTSNSDNWAILIDSSKFYFNYRHTVNTLLVYQLLKRFHFEDDHILLMLPENHQCHPRNIYPGKIEDSFHSEDLMKDIELDYRGAEVNPEQIIGLLTGRHPELTPSNKRLKSSEKSKVFLYLTGHGGNGYFKIQDTQVILSADLANAVYEMYFKGMFEEMLIFIDSCQALSIYDFIELGNVHGLSSSLPGEPAKSYGSHSELGVSATDHFTYFFVEMFRGKNESAVKDLSLEKLMKRLPSNVIKSHIGVKSKLKNYEIFLEDFIVNKKNGRVEKRESEFREAEGRIWGESKEEEEDKVEVRGKVFEEKALGLMGVGVVTLAVFLSGFSRRRVNKDN